MKPNFQEPMFIAIRKSDIRHIRITCRCGKISIAEVPQQIAAGLNLHPCPGCGAGYSITFRDKQWIIERIADSVQEMTFEDETKKDNWKH